MISNQEFFTKVVTHLRQQKAQCHMPGGSCAYFYNDKRCAIGGALPIELAKKLGVAMINIKDIYTVAKHPDWSESVPQETAIEILAHMPEDKSLAAKLQSLHDTFVPEEWELKLQDISQQFNLKLPAP